MKICSIKNNIYVSVIYVFDVKLSIQQSEYCNYCKRSYNYFQILFLLHFFNLPPIYFHLRLVHMRGLLSNELPTEFYVLIGTDLPALCI